MLMGRMMSAVVCGLLVLGLMLSVAPARAGTTTMVAIPTTEGSDPPFQLAESELEGASTLFHEISRMSPEQIVAIGVGAGAAGYAAETYIGGGVYTIIAVVLGAALATHWYEENHKLFGLF
jgi:hypothetical protein